MNDSFEKRDDLSIVVSWPFLERQSARWSQTTNLTQLCSFPGVGPGPRVIHLKFKEK
jgi:hypothetical protein